MDARARRAAVGVAQLEEGQRLAAVLDDLRLAHVADLLHRLAAVIRRDLRDLRPRDQIDVQSFIWVQGSDEYS